MLDIKFVRENPEKVAAGAAKKGVAIDVAQLVRLDEQRRAAIKALDDLRADHNAVSKKITELAGDEKERAIAESRAVKSKLDELEAAAAAAEKAFQALMRKIPNPPFDDVPVGPDDSGNVTIREVGAKPAFDFEPKDYIALAEALDLIDTERAARVSGSRFGYLKREAAMLEFALVRYVLDFVTDERNIAKIIAEEKLSLLAWPFVPVVPPVLIRPDAMEAMGYVERGGEEIYYLEKDGLYLVGTSEQSVGPMHRDEMFAEGSLPVRYVAFSTCFRREAGSYGKDTKGILRVHQFDKAEMFVFSTPETSKDEHRLLLGIEERLMRGLGLPYRVLNICTGDLGDPAAAKFDIEAWLPGQNGGKGEYRETHSTSNTTDFQARRLNIKLRRADGGTEYLHMLNGTAFAIGRALIAILENYQRKDGSIGIPEALQPHLGGLKAIQRP